MSDTESTCPPQIMSLALANNHLAVQLYQLLAEDKGNVFFSPFSVSTAMSMLLCAAEGETESEIRAVLGHDHAALTRNEIASAFEQQLSLLLKNPDSYTLCCANLMLTQKDFEVKDGYKQILAESFKALLLEVDFKLENEKAVIQINEWVKEKTKGMIPKSVESLDRATVIALLNAVYFKGTWLRQFNESATFPRRFYNNGIKENVKQVNMMHLTFRFPIYEDKSMQALQLSYIGEEVAMLIILPREKNGLEKIEAGLTPSFLQDLRRKLRTREVEVSLPRFRLEYQKFLTSCFQRLGVSRVFKHGAELGFASDSPNLAVSEVLHKAVLEVNEEGTEAVACTIVTAQKVSLGPVFVADHPFALLIYDTRSDLILFMGRVDEL